MKKCEREIKKLISAQIDVNEPLTHISLSFKLPSLLSIDPASARRTLYANRVMVSICNEHAITLAIRKIISCTLTACAPDMFNYSIKVLSDFLLYILLKVVARFLSAKIRSIRYGVAGERARKSEYNNYLSPQAKVNLSEI